MKPILLLAAVAALASTSNPVSAEEGGCLKYGAGGAVAGRFAERGTQLVALLWMRNGRLQTPRGSERGGPRS